MEIYVWTVNRILGLIPILSTYTETQSMILDAIPEECRKTISNI